MGGLVGGANGAGGSPAHCSLSPALAARPAQRAAAKEARRGLLAAERKLLFMMAWANEQPGEGYSLLALAAATEHDAHLRTLRSGGAAEGGGSRLEQLARQAAAPAPLPRPLIQELD